MTAKGFATPVLFIIFNRPDTTDLVFDAIRRVRPASLYIAADGPRPQVESDVALCGQARGVRDSVDWDCKVKTRYGEENLGPDKAVSSAIDWFFENVSEGIILEDDCLPDQRFFWYCQELLQHYRDDTRVMHICGSNFLGKLNEKYSYYFSRHAPIRGWASWRRAWKLNGFEKTRYEAIRQHGFFDEYFPSRIEKLSWFRIFDGMARNPDKQGQWVYRWDFSRFIQSGLSVIPRENLVTSLNSREDKTQAVPNPSSLGDSLLHPPFVIRNMEADKQYFSTVINIRRVARLKALELSLVV
jgi:hypothetical protein